MHKPVPAAFRGTSRLSLALRLRGVVSVLTYIAAAVAIAAGSAYLSCWAMVEASSTQDACRMILGG